MNERQLRWVGEVGVHFVNAVASGRVLLTFGTDTVRFVNTTPRWLRLLTKCTTPCSPQCAVDVRRRNA